ncbi:hypothetical protein PRNP1_000104 [Phytophthora ramorum]
MALLMGQILEGKEAADVIEREAEFQELLARCCARADSLVVLGLDLEAQIGIGFQKSRTLGAVFLLLIGCSSVARVVFPSNAFRGFVFVGVTGTGSLRANLIVVALVLLLFGGSGNSDVDFGYDGPWRT